jgi:hypothetical protein
MPRVKPINYDQPSNSRADSGFLPNYVEYITPLKEKKYIMPRRFTILGIIIALYAIACLLPAMINILTPFLPVLLILVSFVSWYIWRFASIEHEYVINHGEITIDAIYGRRQRKKIYTAALKNMEIVAPANGAAPKAEGITREVFAASKLSNSNTWYAIINEEKGGKTLLYFEMIEKAEKALRFYHSAAFQGR